MNCKAIEAALSWDDLFEQVEEVLRSTPAGGAPDQVERRARLAKAHADWSRNLASDLMNHSPCARPARALN